MSGGIENIFFEDLGPPPKYSVSILTCFIFKIKLKQQEILKTRRAQISSGFSRAGARPLRGGRMPDFFGNNI